MHTPYHQARPLVSTSGRPLVPFTTLLLLLAVTLSTVPLHTAKSQALIKSSSNTMTNINSATQSKGLTATNSATGRIAFVSNRDGNEEIYVMQADGSGTTRLTNHPASDSSPTWSPDGTLIAFASSRDRGNTYNKDIYVMRADGSQVRRLTTIEGYEPAWSPDGTRIAFASQQGIYAINTGGSGLRRLTTERDSSPTWSPDSTRIAFMSWRNTNPNLPYQIPSLYIMQADGSNQSRITDGLIQNPQWSPNGNLFLYYYGAGHQAGDFRLEVMNIDGSNPKQLPKYSLLDTINPTWSPDGTQIAFAGSRTAIYESADIYTMNIDGTGLKQLTSNTGINSEPAWSPVKPSSPLTVATFTGGGYTLQQNCYELLVIVRNNTTQPIAQAITLQETTRYRKKDNTFAGLPSNRTDSLRDCDTNASLITGGTITKSGTIPANGSLTYRFRLKHDWEWIERKTLAQEAFKFIIDKLFEVFTERNQVLPGLTWVKLLKNAADLDDFLNDVQDAMNALPVAQYTYTLNTPELTAPSAQTMEVEIDPWRQGYLRGSLTAGAEMQVTCLFSKSILVAPGCAFAYLTSVCLYFAAYGSVPLTSLQATSVLNSSDYTQLVEPQPIIIPALDAIADTNQRIFAQRYLEALSLDRAALASLEKAKAAQAANDITWTATQFGRVQLFHTQEQQVLNDAASVGGRFLPTMPALTVEERQQYKDQLASTGFDPEVAAILRDLGVSEAEQQAVTQTLSNTTINDWPTPPDALFPISRHSEALGEIINSIPSLRNYLPLIKRN